MTVLPLIIGIKFFIPFSADLISVTQSIQKCQFVMYAEEMHPTLKRFKSYFMTHYKTVAI